MQTSDALTYDGALAILGQRQHALITKIDDLLGVTILADGMVGANWLFAMMDQNNEAMTLIRQLVDHTAEALTHRTGFSRYQLVTAAHTTIVYVSFFEALRSRIDRHLPNLKLATRKNLIIGRPAAYSTSPTGMIDRLLRVEIPQPWQGEGLTESIPSQIAPKLRRMAEHCFNFLDGLTEWERICVREPDRVRLVKENLVDDDAVAIYEALYRRLAADVPEFGMWVALSETHAIRRQIRQTQVEIVEHQQRSLRELENRLQRAWSGAQGTDASRRVHEADMARSATGRHRISLAQINRAHLGQAILNGTTMQYAPHLRFPTVDEGYVTPYFRHVVYRTDAPLAQEAWWGEQSLYTDLDLFLAAHLSSPHSALRPLVVLGHPGAGKSLLTRVIAARLPVASHTAVWVPLRHVNAETQIHRQIEEALYATTNGRVSWTELVDETAEETIRVVILDGLDELIQASGVSQSRYLIDVQEFQYREMVLGKPVAVIVTSRVVAAERVDIPDATNVVKIEDFTNGQVRQWLGVWNGTNGGAADFRPLEAEHALTLPALARQPLLLLMLALYTADSHTTDLAKMRSSADLYGKLVNNFIRREVTKDAETPTGRGLDIERASAPRRFQLAIAAFAMFNRGRQYVTEPELQQDLESLLGRLVDERKSFAEPLNHAAKTVGQFFFVHAPSANAHHDARHGLHRTYEFLHATFGEYLIAAEVMDLVYRLAERRAYEYHEQSPYREVLDDAKLRGLLSHQVLAKRASILDLAREYADEFPDDAAPWICTVLDELLQDIRTRTHNTTVRPEPGAVAYDPSRNDPSTRRAVYSCNLVLLRLILTNDSIRISCFVTSPDPAAALAGWRFLVSMWHSCLDEEAWQAVLATMTTRPEAPDMAKSAPVLERRAPDAIEANDARRFYGVAHARLFADYSGEGILRSGLASWAGQQPRNDEDAQIHVQLMQRHYGEHGSADLGSFYQRMSSVWPRMSAPTRRLLLSTLAKDAPLLPFASVFPFSEFLCGYKDVSALADLASVAAAHPALIKALLPTLLKAARQHDRRAVFAAASTLVGAAQFTTDAGDAELLRTTARDIAAVTTNSSRHSTRG